MLSRRKSTYYYIRFSFIDVMLFSVFFLIIYFENYISIGLKLSELWKILLLAYLGLQIINVKKGITHPILILGLLLAFKNLIHSDIVNISMRDVSNMFKMLILPVVTISFYNMYYKNPLRLFDLILKISIFFILSTIPFHLGLIKQMSVSGDMQVFGVEEESYFTGFFENAGIATKTFVISLSIILINYKYLAKRYMSYIKVFSLLVIGTYSIYICFMRTGWFSYFFAILFILFYKKPIKYVLARIPILAILVWSLFIFYSSNDIVQMRINDTSVRKVEKGLTDVALEQRGSGRIYMANAALENWVEGGLGAMIIGYSLNTIYELMDDKIGHALSSHNFMIDLMQNNGLIGLILFIMLLYQVYKIIFFRHINRILEIDKIKTVRVFFYIYILYTFFSGGAGIYIDIMFGMTLAYVMIKINRYESEVLKVES